MKTLFSFLMTSAIGLNCLAQAPTSGLLSRYSFNSTAMLYTDNHNGNYTLTNVGGVGTVAGYQDSAASFAGNSRLSVAHNDFNPGSVSLAAWFKVTGSAQYATIAVVRYNTNSMPYNSFNLCTGSYVQNKVAFYFSTSSYADVMVTSTTVVQSGTWYHAIAVYDENTGQARLYINGNIEGNASLSNPEPLIYSDNTFAIGHVPSGTMNVNGNGFVGAIDEVLVYNRALAANEIASVFDETPPVATGWNEYATEPSCFWPNPVSAVLTLSAKPNETTQIFDVQGKCMGSYSGAAEIDLSSWPRGIYLVRTSNGQQQKLIKE